MTNWQRHKGGRFPLARYFHAAILAIYVLTLSPLVFAQSVADSETTKTGLPATRSGDPSGATQPSANPTPDNAVVGGNSRAYVGEMYQIGLGWHPAALEGLPTDKFGLVDWVAALEQGLIKPRDGIEPDGPQSVPFDMNIVMPSKTGMIAGAYFPHKTHTTWMSCDSCHIKIYKPLAGSNDLTMSTIVDGQACGVCHGKVAFPLNDCARCHIAHAGVEDADVADQ